jgi:ubiquinone biosynthesis protein COQ4
MDVVENTAPPIGARAPGVMKTDWLRALRALRRLLADKEDTAQVFEIMRSMNGKATLRNYYRLLSTIEGGRIAYERVELARKLMDDAWLDSLPDGSVGAAYRQFVRSEQLSAQGLVDVSRKGLSRVEDPHPYAWFGRRMRDGHDLWHVLSGYGRDALGEGCLVAFSYAQTKGAGWAMIAIGAALRPGRARGQPYKRALWEGYRRGRAARWLPGEDYEKLLRESLEAARQRLGIYPPTIYDSIPMQFRDPPRNAAGAVPY